MKRVIKIVIAVLLVLAAIIVAFYNFFTENSVTYFASIVAVCGTVAILFQIIFRSKKNESKEVLPMKKKLTIAVTVIAIIVVAAFAWCIGYANHKSTDNLPTLAMVAEMEDASFLVGYRSNQLITVWGEPDEKTPTTIGGVLLSWKIDDETVLRVHIDDKDKVAYYLLDEGV